MQVKVAVATPISGVTVLVFADAAERVPGTWTAGPTHDLTVNALKDEFGRVANGEITFEEALDNVQDMTVEELEAMGLNVAS